MPNELVTLRIADIDVRQDAHGRFSLNDLHRASGGEKRHQPSNWLQLDQTKELIEEFRNPLNFPVPAFPGTEQIQPLMSIRGGDPEQQGTFVVKELVYAYAMWVKPAFHLKVIRTFDAVANAAHQTPTQLLQPQLYWNNTPVTDSETVQRLARMGAKRFADHFCLAHERKLLVRDTHFFLLMDEEFDVFLGQNPKIVLQAFRITPRDRGVLLWSTAGVMVLVPSYIQHTQQISLPPNY